MAKTDATGTETLNDILSRMEGQVAQIGLAGSAVHCLAETVAGDDDLQEALFFIANSLTTLKNQVEDARMKAWLLR
jgi:hypothetical protein